MAYLSTEFQDRRRKQFTLLLANQQRSTSNHSTKLLAALTGDSVAHLSTGFRGLSKGNHCSYCFLPISSGQPFDHPTSTSISISIIISTSTSISISTSLNYQRRLNFTSAQPHFSTNFNMESTLCNKLATTRDDNWIDLKPN